MAAKDCCRDIADLPAMADCRKNDFERQRQFLPPNSQVLFSSGH